MDPSTNKSFKPGSTRRSQRLLLTVRVVVSGKQPTGSAFAEDTVTQVINAHGALVLLKQAVTLGDRLRLRNVKTGDEVGCIVVDIGEVRDRICSVGVEFDHASPRFWHISFPPDDWSTKSVEAKRYSAGPRPATKQPG